MSKEGKKFEVVAVHDSISYPGSPGHAFACGSIVTCIFDDDTDRKLYSGVADAAACATHTFYSQLDGHSATVKAGALVNQWLSDDEVEEM